MEKTTTDRNISVRRNTVTERINDIPYDMLHHLRQICNIFQADLTSMDESTDVIFSQLVVF